MPCLTAVASVSLRPMAANDTRPTYRAAETKSLKVLAWLNRRSMHTLRTQAIASLRSMAVPSAVVSGLRLFLATTFYQKGLGGDRQLFPTPNKTGDDSGRKRRGRRFASCVLRQS